MNLWRNSWTCRQVARLLPLLFLTPLVSCFAAQPAMAVGQVGSIPVAVVDFRNETSVGGSMLGRRAADALAVALQKTDKFDLSRRAEVENQMALDGLNPPLDSVSLMKLGEELERDSMISGRVVAASISKRVAKVTLAVEMRDVISGELVNGAMVSASSGVGVEGVDDDALLDEALNKAAYMAQRSMVEYNLPQGTVLAATFTMGKNEALLNVGSRSGIRVGMDMIVLRGSEQVGRVRVARVNANDSTAIVTSAPKGVRPEDKVRAIFSLPKSAPKEGEPTMPTQKTGRSKMSGIGKMLSGLIVLAGLVFLVGGANSGGIARDATVAPGYDGEPFVRATWKTPKGMNADALIEYQLWRNDVTATPVWATQAIEYIDRLSARSVVYHTVGDGLGSGSTGDLALADAVTVAGITAGTSYTYYVTTVYKTIGTDDQGATVTIWKIGPQVQAGQATPLDPPALRELADGDTFTTSKPVSLMWDTVRGADRYEVQVANNPSFTGGSVLTLPVVQSNAPAGTTISVPQAVSLQKFAGDQFVYWRVGARNSSDTVQDIVFFRGVYRTLQQNTPPPPPPT